MIQAIDTRYHEMDPVDGLAFAAADNGWDKDRSRSN